MAIAWRIGGTLVASMALGVLSLATLPVSPARADAAKTVTAENVTAKDVDDAMKRGVDAILAYFKTIDWTKAPEPRTAARKDRDYGGEYAGELYALLHVGESMDDSRLDPASPELKPVVQWMLKVEPYGTYALGLHASALGLLPNNEANRDPLRKTEEFLLTHSLDETGAMAGGFGYAPKEGRVDHSVSQYGVLGLWAGQDAGLEMPLKLWPMVDAMWRRDQNADGGWQYVAEHAKIKQASTDAMTYAGLATLYVTTESLDTEVRGFPRPDPNIEAGLAWMDANYKITPGNLYAMYGLERVGLASGRKFFGGHNWYKEGAAALVNGQQADGSWGSQWLPHQLGTGYALLFLARGRNAVVFNKLQYNGDADDKLKDDGHWNDRPRDDANITNKMSKAFEKPLNWQIVNLQVSPDEWLDAPVLLIVGAKDPKFTKEDVAKFKQFVEAGGIIFSIAETGGTQFTNAIKKVGMEIVTDVPLGGEKPEPKYEWRQLPKDHPLFTIRKELSIKNPPRIEGLSNGVRELWIHSTVDMSASWQAKHFATADHFIIPENLYFYANGRASLKNKLDSLVVRAPAVAPTATIKMARLQYAGNWDPEPGAWPRMAKLAAADFGRNITLISEPIQKLAFADTPVAHLTGSTGFSLSDMEVASLKAFLDAGGTLLVDSAGGNVHFTDAFNNLAKSLATNATLDFIPQDDPLYTSRALPSTADLSPYRVYTVLNESPGRQPKLLGIKQNGRWVVVFSQYDITSGLLGTGTWGINGYRPEWSEALTRNVLLYATTPRNVAASQPAATQTASTQPAGTQPAQGVAVTPATQPAASAPSSAPATQPTQVGAGR